MVLAFLHMEVQVISSDSTQSISVLLQSYSEKVPGGARFSPLPTDSFASLSPNCAVVSTFPCTLSRVEHIKLQPRNQFDTRFLHRSSQLSAMPPCKDMVSCCILCSA